MTTIDILMPALSPTMSSGNLVRWLKNEGDQIKRGEVICEIETDKSIVEFEAVDEGHLGRILVSAGSESVPVNQSIATLVTQGSEAARSSGTAPDIASHEASPATESRPAVPNASSPASKTGGDDAPSHRVFASPVARRIARAKGIDLANIKGSGPRGRIVRADVEVVQKGTTDIPPIAGAHAVASAGGSRYRDIPVSPMRKAIARRLGEAKATIPHFYQTIDCNVDALLKWRKELNARSDAYALSVNDFVIRAVALALRAVPAANASWHENVIRIYEEVDVAVAVATPVGLITPIIKNADQKGVVAISNEVKALAQKAREGRLSPAEYEGGGFTISNLGMYGVREFAAIINPPQAGILAVGAAEKRVVVTPDAPDVASIATMMTCTLSADHRVVDGVVGAEFLSAFKKLIEDPIAILVNLGG